MRGRGKKRVTLALAVAATVLVGAGCAAEERPEPKAATGSARPTSPAPTSPAPTRSSPASPAPSAPASPWDVAPASLAALGDSMTRAFDACAVLADCPEASWATGTDAAVNSLAVRLLGPGKAATHTWNLARTGARMAELPEQMARAAAEEPGLVTVMMGANDACRPTPAQMTPVADFRFSFETALARLREDAPEALVYVSSLPDLRHLWSTGRLGAGPDVWKLGICGSMLADPDDLSAAAERRRTSVRERVMAYNEALAEVCAEDRLCRYDGGAVFAYRFGGGQLSAWDWFHPSVAGQARLAEIAYERITGR